MKATLLAYTQLDQILPPDSLLRHGAGTLQENVMEFAGRVCYRSDAKMGHSSDFIALRVREGHEDIVEHVRFVFRVEEQPLDPTLMLLANQPTVEYTDLGEDSWIFSMNARNIRDFWVRSQSQLSELFVRLANPIAPSVYGDLPLIAEEEGRN